MKNPTKKQIANLQLALGMAGLATNLPSCDLILRVQASVRKMGGGFDLKTACEIGALVEQKYTVKKRNGKGKIKRPAN